MVFAKFIGVSMLVIGIIVILIVGFVNFGLGSIADGALPKINQNQEISEFRSDGVEIVHYQDGSKLYKVTMEDGMSPSDEIP